jgi:carboxymethylenebutenolidase
MCWSKECAGEGVSRKEFLAGGSALVAGMGANPAAGQAQDQKPPTRVLDDPRVEHGKVRFKHNGMDTIDGYLARPKAEGTYPAVLVISGNRITEEYIPNTCAALALAGFVGLAPNIFHPLPDDAKTEEDYNRALANHTEQDQLRDIQEGMDYLWSTSYVQPGSMGMIGFCSGGRKALLFAARSREIRAVVAFHPAPMQAKELTRVKVPVQVHQGTGDRVVSVDSTRKTEQMLRAQKTPVEVFLYEGADHGFLAYTRPFYKPDYAKLAWKRTVAFLGRHLKKASASTD